jgi:hypothetical protein
MLSLTGTLGRSRRRWSKIAGFHSLHSANRAGWSELHILVIDNPNTFATGERLARELLSQLVKQSISTWIRRIPAATSTALP